MVSVNQVRCVVVGYCIAFLSACTSVPITSYPKLASIDPETMDMRQIEIAVRLQDDFAIIEDSVIIDVSLLTEDTGDLLEKQFILEESPGPLTPALKRKAKQGYAIHRYRMDAATGEAAMAHRAQIVALRNAKPGDQHEGTFSATAGVCRKPGSNPFLTPRMTLLIRFSPEEDFFTMFKETKVDLPKDETGQEKYCANPLSVPN